ncbi:hypothetical protein D3C72_1711610 [compost metagenome]
MGELQSCLPRDLLHGQMVGGKRPGRAVCQFAGMCPGVGDIVAQRLDWRRYRHDDAEDIARQPDDVTKVLRIPVDVGGVRQPEYPLRDHRNRVAVRLCGLQHLRRQHARRARLVLDDDSLAEDPRGICREHAHRHVSGATGRKAQQYPDRPVRVAPVGLRICHGPNRL